MSPKKAELEAKQQRERELAERQRRIDASAEKLCDDERLRLKEMYRHTIDDLRKLSSWEFECVIAGTFDLLGFEVEQTPRTNDYGRDAIMWKGGKKYLLECKNYQEGGLSRRPDLQKLHSAMTTDGAVSGFFVTSAGFTKDAIEFAPTLGIKLIDQYELVRLMFASKPAGIDDDSYRSMCRQCEEIVFHRLGEPRTSVKCPNGHEVAPMLSIESISPARPQPRHRAPERRFGTLQERAGRRGSEIITGNTYPVRNELRAFGGRWEPNLKAWLVPAGKAELARALVAGAQSPIAELPDEYRPAAEADVVSALRAPSASGIRAGDRVEVLYLDDNKTAAYTVSESQNDPANGVLSVASPLGRQLLGLVEGDETEFKVGDQLRRVRIIRVEACARNGTGCKAHGSPKLISQRRPAQTILQ